MYVVIAKAAYKADNEIFKKHFAKSMGNDMCEEKVALVQMMLAKLVAIVPRGYSKSADKVHESLVKHCVKGEVR